MFAKSNQIEQFLTLMGAEWKYVNNIAFTELVPNWKEVNMARPTPLREEAVEQYATLMEAGSAAPAPILHPTQPGYDILDGVQRIAAADFRPERKFSSYVVTSASHKILMAIRMLANARMQGRPEQPDWTKRRAVEVLCLEEGMAVGEVAKMGGWRPSDCDRILTNLNWGCTIRGIGGPQEMSDAMIETLQKHTTQQSLLKEPHVKAEFLAMLKQAQFSANDSDPLMEEFFGPVSKTAKAHEVYKERLEDIRQSPEVVTRITGRRTTHIPPDVNLRRVLRAADTVLDRIAAGTEPLLYVDEFFKLINDLKEKLHRLSKNQKPVQSKTPADKWAKDE